MRNRLRRIAAAVLLIDDDDQAPNVEPHPWVELVEEIRYQFDQTDDITDAYILAEWIVHEATGAVARKKHDADNQRPENRRTIAELDRLYNRPAYMTGTTHDDERTA